MVMLPLRPSMVIKLSIWGVLASRIRLRMASVTTMISQAAMRPELARLGSSCWDKTARRVVDS